MKFSNQVEKLFEQDLVGEFDDSEISAEVIADSVNANNSTRLTTLRIKMPRMILSEFNTHRVLSKCQSSSRAIPTKKLRQRVLQSPFMPIYWGANKSGMQATEQLTGFKRKLAKGLWKFGSKVACLIHWSLEKAGVHKQTCNRLIEPWLYTTGTVSGTEWDNFFKLRYSNLAQPEIIVLAKKIHDAMVSSEPKKLSNGEYHLPWISQEEFDSLGLDQCIKISVARCARSSYENNLGKKSQPEEDLKLYDRLLAGGHFSAFEHIGIVSNKHYNGDYSRNFQGWYQYRAFVDHPNAAKLPTKNDKKNTNKTKSKVD